MVLTRTPSPWMLRKTARNRVGNQLTRTPDSESAAQRSQPYRPDLPSSLLTPRTGRRPQARPVSRRTICEVTTVWLGRSDWSRRDTRQRAKRLGSGPIGGGGDSPVTHRAPGYRHDCAQSRGSNQPPPSSLVRARTSRFSAATREFKLFSFADRHARGSIFDQRAQKSHQLDPLTVALVASSLRESAAAALCPTPGSSSGTERRAPWGTALRSSREADGRAGSL